MSCITDLCQSKLYVCLLQIAILASGMALTCPPIAASAPESSAMAAMQAQQVNMHYLKQRKGVIAGVCSACMHMCLQRPVLFCVLLIAAWLVESHEASVHQKP